MKPHHCDRSTFFDDNAVIITSLSHVRALIASCLFLTRSVFSVTIRGRGQCKDKERKSKVAYSSIYRKNAHTHMPFWNRSESRSHWRKFIFSSRVKKYVYVQGGPKTERLNPILLTLIILWCYPKQLPICRLMFAKCWTYFDCTVYIFCFFFLATVFWRWNKVI